MQLVSRKISEICKKFAKEQIGNFVQSKSGDLIIRFNSGLKTIQVYIRGKPDNSFVEISTLNRLGRELYFYKMRVSKFNPKEFEAALHLSL